MYEVLTNSIHFLLWELKYIFGQETMFKHG